MTNQQSLEFLDFACNEGYQVNYIKDNLHKTNRQIAAELNISFHRVRNLQRKYKCCRSANEVYELKREIGKRETGQSNRNWKGGISLDNMHYKRMQIERYPKHIKARQIVAAAVRAGKLIKKNCELCGNSNTQAHHEDYTKPLTVLWVCSTCHRKIHQFKKAV